MTQKNERGLTNTKLKDSSSKIIFMDPILCAQFLKNYVDIPILRDVQPEDIKDETHRFVSLFTEERSSDVVKRIRLRKKKVPFYLISIIEHKSKVDYNVAMQIFRYITFIWEDYEKKCERKHRGISKTKGFKYPPILPIIYYEGSGSWTAAVNLHDRVYLSSELGKYIPDYQCIVMQLNRYTYQDLMEKADELSVIMMLNKLQRAADFSSLKKEVPTEYLDKVTEGTPEYLLKTIGDIVKILLRKINVPQEEAEAASEQVKGRNMGELFANFEAYDVQATREKARKEGLVEGRAEGLSEGLAEGLLALVRTMKPILKDCDKIYEAVVGNEEYADISREKVTEYYQMCP